MSEENVNVEEQTALSNGWKPKDQWEGDENLWVPAEEFNRRGELIGNLIKEQKSNKKLKDELTELRESVKLLGEHNKKVLEQAKKEALEELKQLKKEALKDGDVDSVVEIDDKIDDIKSEKVETITTETTNQAPPEMVDWLEKNQWYEDNTILKSAFDAIVISLVNEDPELVKAPATALEEATKRIKEEFPEKFENKPRKTNQTVLDKTTKKSAKAKGKYSVGMMSEEQKKVAQRLVNAGAGLTMEDYAQQLGELGELG